MGRIVSYYTIGDYDSTKYLTVEDALEAMSKSKHSGWYDNIIGRMEDSEELTEEAVAFDNGRYFIEDSIYL